MNSNQPKSNAENLQTDDWELFYRTAEQAYVRGDYQEAFSWYKKASELPDCNPIVSFEIGYLYQHGEGVELDNVEALKWYEKAASFDVPQAMYNLAYFYQNGLVVDRDFRKAAQLLRNATFLMDRLVLERDSYKIQKTDFATRFSEMEMRAEENRVISERVQLRNGELNDELLVAREKCLHLERDMSRINCLLQEKEKQCGLLVMRADSAEDALQKEHEIRIETESTASAREKQMKEELHSAAELITNLVKEHNASFERVQLSCASEVNCIQNAFDADFAVLQKENRQIREGNEKLSRILGEKEQEINGLQESLQQLQVRFKRNRKQKRIAVILAVIFGLIVLLVCFVLF